MNETRDIWSEHALETLYEDRLKFSTTTGVDRVAPDQLGERLPDELAVISRKVPNGCYRFAPYAQLLRTKGRNKPPREICIPTARDRIVLLQLKEQLHRAFPAKVNRVLPNSMARSALEAFREADPKKHVCIRLDIKRFYDSIDHDTLLEVVGSRLTPEETKLVRRAIRNPAVPRGSRRADVPRSRRTVGVPQGLAISNVLANIFLGDLDHKAKSEAVAYYRFVDDILIVVEEARVSTVYEQLRSDLEDKGLQVHPLTPRTRKGGVFKLHERIEFLGYVLEGPRISVRDPSVDRFMDNIAARVTRYRKERSRLVRLHDWMTPEVARRVLIDELNERITGAISDSRRYGWMFYFSSMTDEALVFELDAAIDSIVTRLPEFKTGRPDRLKRLARAFHEVNHRPNGSYIHNYDRLATMKQRLDFLVERGQVGPDDLLTEDQINLLFERYREQQLNELKTDLAFLS